MWTGILAKFISTAIISVTAVALAAWALRIRERQKSGERRPDKSGKRPRSRLPRVAKWTGVAMCVLLASAWLASLRWTADYYFSYSRPCHSIGLKKGAIAYFRAENLSIIPDPAHIQSGWWIMDSPASNWDARISFDRTGIVITVRIWMPLLLSALVTAGAWWLERRRPPLGHCACGYNLTGNVSGTCPECGERV